MTDRTNKPIGERFNLYVDKSEGSDACWPWTGARQPKGYGMFSRIPGTRHAHRIAWILKNGPIPAGRLVCHRCDNPPCCNPAHLFLGSNAENTADKMQKGRHRSPEGERHWQAKLTPEMVRQIRASDESLSSIALRFGVDKTTVWAVKRGKTWGHVH